MHPCDECFEEVVKGGVSPLVKKATLAAVEERQFTRPLPHDRDPVKVAEKQQVSEATSQRAVDYPPLEGIVEQRQIVCFILHVKRESAAAIGGPPGDYDGLTAERHFESCCRRVDKPHLAVLHQRIRARRVARTDDVH